MTSRERIKKAINHQEVDRIPLVPGTALKYPRGIRDPQKWIMAHIEHPGFSS